MELIYTNLDNINIPKDIVACLGVFDGIHEGHNNVINKVKEVSANKKLKSALITFDPHPDFVLGKIKQEQYITPINERINIIKNNYNLDYVIIIEFTKKLASINYDEFYDLFLNNIEVIVVGEGFRFGYKNIGTVDDLIRKHRSNKKEVVSVTHSLYNSLNKKISSQDIIILLKAGKVKEIANIGKRYQITGTVSKGSQIGNKIGYPTANIQISDKYYPIKNGVYSVVIIVNNIRYLGIANYGYNPSFNEINKPRLEVHIFNFNEDIYKEVVVVEFIDFIREERKFNSIDEFLIQLDKDCNKCINECGGKYETVNCRGNG